MTTKENTGLDEKDESRDLGLRAPSAETCGPVPLDTGLLPPSPACPFTDKKTGRCGEPATRLGFCAKHIHACPVPFCKTIVNVAQTACADHRCTLQGCVSSRPHDECGDVDPAVPYCAQHTNPCAWPGGCPQRCSKDRSRCAQHLCKSRSCYQECESAAFYPTRYCEDHRCLGKRNSQSPPCTCEAFSQRQGLEPQECHIHYTRCSKILGGCDCHPDRCDKPSFGEEYCGVHCCMWEFCAEARCAEGTGLYCSDHLSGRLCRESGCERHSDGRFCSNHRCSAEDCPLPAWDEGICRMHHRKRFPTQTPTDSDDDSDAGESDSGEDSDGRGSSSDGED